MNSCNQFVSSDSIGITLLLFIYFYFLIFFSLFLDENSNWLDADNELVGLLVRISSLYCYHAIIKKWFFLIFFGEWGNCKSALLIVPWWRLGYIGFGYWLEPQPAKALVPVNNEGDSFLCKWYFELGTNLRFITYCYRCLNSCLHDLLAAMPSSYSDMWLEAASHDR